MKTTILLWFTLTVFAIPGIAAQSADQRSTTKDPKVAVTVLGAVNKQGIVRLKEPTLITVLAESGGWSAPANLLNVSVLRKGPDGGAEKMVINVKSILNGETPDPEMKEGDVVHVPERIM